MRIYFLIIFIFQIINVYSNNKFLSFEQKEYTPIKNNKIYKLVLIRHGQSSFNQENLFTGWTDVDLTNVGVEEAENAGNLNLINVIHPH